MSPGQKPTGTRPAVRRGTLAQRAAPRLTPAMGEGPPHTEQKRHLREQGYQAGGGWAGALHGGVGGLRSPLVGVGGWGLYTVGGLESLPRGPLGDEGQTGRHHGQWWHTAQPWLEAVGTQRAHVGPQVGRPAGSTHLLTGAGSCQGRGLARPTCLWPEGGRKAQAHDRRTLVWTVGQGSRDHKVWPPSHSLNFLL